jgi:3-hydroxyisobutyrate dehydrogenase
MQSIGVIGAGSMGAPIAWNLVKAGYRVSVCDIRDEALAPFRAKGIQATARAGDLAANDVVIVMVGNDKDVADVTVGHGGLVEGIDPAKAPHVVIMSSVLPKTIFDAAEVLGEKGATVSDAPVSGGPVRAADATMSIMAAGSDELFVNLKPVFDALGRPVFHCGPVGSAAGVKIVNNILGVANMLLMNEAAHLATRLGIDMPFLASVMDVSSGRNFASGNYGAYRDLLLANSNDPEVTKRLLKILRKDLKLASTLAKDVEIGTPVLHAVSLATDAIEEDDLVARWQATARELP